MIARNSLVALLSAIAFCLAATSVEAQLPLFTDVPYDHPQRLAIERIARAGVTLGCGVGLYCPDASTTRSQMATFLGRAKHGPAFAPNASSVANPFTDVPADHPLKHWIIQGYSPSYVDRFLTACTTSPLAFCPDSPILRDLVAEWLLKAKHGGSYTPSPATGTLFADVPASAPHARYIEQLYRESITAGCDVNPLRYCPTTQVPRAAMALFLTRAFDLVPSVAITQVTLQGTAQSTIVIEATATANDPADAVTQVTFYQGAATLCQVPPNGSGVATCTWTAPSPGTYLLTATALDSNGRTRTSAALPVSLPNLETPTASLITPIPGTAYLAPATIAVTAFASDSGPENGGLRFRTTHAAGGNAYSYRRIHDGPYTVAAGDHLEYDYFVEGGSITGAGVGGFEIDLTTAPSNGRSAGLVDQSAQPIHVPTPSATGRWLSRRIPLAPVQGKVISSFNLVVESDLAGPYSVLYRDVRVTDGASTLRYSIWTGGTLDSNVTAYGNLASAISVSPPQPMIRFTTTHASGANAYTYHRIHDGPYSIGAGDHLEYDYFVESGSITGWGVGAFEIDLTSAPWNGRAAGLVDQNAHPIHVSTPSATGVWLSRRISLAAIQGRVVDSFNLVVEYDVPGLYSVLYRNVRVTDGASTTRYPIWTAGALDTNVTAYSSLASAIAAAPAAATISRFDFLVGTDVVASTTTLPFSTTLTNVPPGNYVLFGRAVDNQGLMKRSDGVPIAVCGPPAVTLTSPTNGQAFPAGASIPLRATASVASGCGSIQRVEYYAGATLLGSSTAALTFPVATTLGPGTHSITARAFDARTFANSIPAVITVNAAAPVITTLQTSGNSTVTGSPVVFHVNATDADSSGSLSVVLRNAQGAVVATGTQYATNMFVVSWTPATAGSHVLTVDVFDPTSLHATQNVTVSAVVPPTSAAPAPEIVIPGSYATPTIGTTGATFAVSDSGAAAYAIPIVVPPGTAGVQPSLSLAYSSQGGNGSLGVGWSLSGLSTITRCPKTEAQDGVRTGVNYDDSSNNDAYCLDGQRLVPIFQDVVSDDVYPDPRVAPIDARRVEYRTEADTYARIESYESRLGAAPLPAGPYRFVVRSKSGQVAHYGSRYWIVTAGWTQRVSNMPGGPATDDTRANAPKVWVVDYIVDRSGNFMEIDYTDRELQTTGASRNVYHAPYGINCGFVGLARLLKPIGAFPNVEYWPTQIRYYAANAPRSECGNAPKGIVTFGYEDVPSQANVVTRDRHYDSGAGQSTLSKRLNNIETRIDDTGSNAVLVKSYYLTYGDSQQTRRSLLRSVRECGADGQCLPSTQFEYAEKDWNTTGKNFGSLAVTLPFGVDPANHGITGVHVGDWNGDGKSDLLGWVNTFTGVDYRHDLVLCLATGSGFTCGSGPIAPFATYSDSLPQGGHNGHDVELMDVNNDGMVDVALNLENRGTWQVCISNGDLTCSVAGGAWSTAAPNGPSARGDFDGDGRIDVLNYLGNGIYETCLTRPTGGFLCSRQNVSDQYSGPYPPYPYASCGRYNDDPGTGCESVTGNNVQYQTLIADVNGDGKADLLRRRTDEQGTEAWKDKWKVCFAEFTQGLSQQFNCHDRFVQGAKGKIQDIVVIDFNGDGLADMASTEGNLGVSSPWRVCLSTGDGAFEFRDPNVYWDPALGSYMHPGNPPTPVNYYDSTSTPRCRIWNGTGAATNEKVVFGDFNGDGRSDIASWNAGAGKWRVCLSTGSDFSCADWLGPHIANSNPDLNQWVVSGDFDGDGKTDILCLNGSCNGRLALSTGPPNGDLLTRITNGLGATTDVTYAPLSDTTVYRKPAPSGTPPGARELDIQSPMYVVKSVAASNGIGGNATNRYFYENLRGRTDGRGLYGFEKRRELDVNGIVTEIVYQRVATASFAADWPIVGRPRVVRKYAPTPATYVADITGGGWIGVNQLFGGQMTLVNRVTNAWSTRLSATCAFVACTSSPPIRETLLTATLEDGFELDATALPSTTSTFGNFDAAGNPQNVSVTTSDGYGKATVHTYLNDYANWVVGRVTTSTVTLTKPGSSVVRKSAFTYHGLNGTCAPWSPVPQMFGHLCDEIVEPDFEGDAATFYSLWQKTSHLYDRFGNRTVTTLAFKERDGTLRTRSTTTTYTPATGRFPITISNALGQQETRQYDSRFGTMSSQRGPNGITTTSLVDGLGRVYGQRTLNASSQVVGESFTTIDAVGVTGFERYRVRKLQSGSLETREYFDSLQRGLRVQTRRFLLPNQFAQATTRYDALGRKDQMVAPAGSGTVTTGYSYDVLNRPQQETASGASMSLTTGYAYSVPASITVDGQGVTAPRATTVTQSGTNVASRSTTRHVNSQGQTVRVTDGGGGNTDYVYDAYGNQLKAIGPGGIAETLSYDRRGRKITLASPDGGSWTYAYNGTGELVTQTDGNGQVTRQFYDVLGRVIERREHPGNEATIPFVTVSSYDAHADGSACARGIGKLCETRTASVARGTVGGALPSPQTRSTTTFDVAARPYESMLAIDGRTFRQFTTYDGNGRVDRLMYPSGYMVQTRYESWSGRPDRVAESGGAGTVHWQGNSRLADGQIASMLVGGLTTAKTYDGFGRVNTVSTGSIQTASFTFDALGNLTSRSDPPNGQGTQTFGYDNLSRLTRIDAANISYSPDGNITNRGGAYTYVPGTHRVQTAAGHTYGYHPNGNVHTISGGAGTRTLAYTPFNLPTSIVGPGTNSLAYVYDAAHARVKETSATVAGTAVTYYVGGYETRLRPDNVQEQRHYLATPEGVVGVHTIRSNGANDLRYWHKDHLGSVVAITDFAGTLKQGFTFDAWGNRVIRPVTGGDADKEERGYTGHEHLVEVGLTHMNGRLYDPVTARFLQADPIVQEPWNGQSLNRYAYVFNNPLSYTDPSGYLTFRSFFRNYFRIFHPVEYKLRDNPYARLAGAIVAAYFTGGAAYGWAIAQGASAFGATVAAGTAAGFAAGGIQGGNARSALQGAFVGGLSAGLLFGASEFAASAAQGEQIAGLAGSPDNGYWRMFAQADTPDIRINVEGSRLLDTSAGWTPTFSGQRLMWDFLEWGPGTGVSLATGGFGFGVRISGAVKATRIMRAGDSGAYGSFKHVKGDGLSGHHMPQAAAGRTGYDEGGALVMTHAEHAATRTYGWKGVGTAEADTALSFREILYKDIVDVRSIVGTKYNEGLRGLIDYYRRNFPELMAK